MLFSNKRKAKLKELSSEINSILKSIEAYNSSIKSLEYQRNKLEVFTDISNINIINQRRMIDDRISEIRELLRFKRYELNKLIKEYNSIRR